MGITKEMASVRRSRTMWMASLRMIDVRRRIMAVGPRRRGC